MENEKQIKQIRKYSFEAIEYTDGSIVMNRENKGFSILELLGTFELVKSDILKLLEEAQRQNIDEMNINSSGVPVIHKSDESI